MAKRKATRIREYVDARRDLKALASQKEKYPELLRKPGWLRHFTETKNLVLTLQRDLTGGDLAQAERLLAAPASPPVDA